MEFTYIRDLTHNYMVAHPEGAGEDFVLRMALTQNIEGLLPVEARMIDDELYLYYRTDSLLSLENKSLVRRPRHGDLKELFHALLRVERVLTDYLMGLDSLCLTPETVFTDPADGSWHFTCMPFPKQTGTLETFCESLLTLLDPDDSDAIADAYRICERTQEGHVRLRDLVRLLSEKEEEEEEREMRTHRSENHEIRRNASYDVPEDTAGRSRYEVRLQDDMWEDMEDDDVRFGKSISDTGAHDDDTEKRKPLVRPGILSLLFAVVFFADLYVRRNYVLTAAGNILSLAVAAVCLTGAVGAFVYGRRLKEPKDDFSGAGWSDASSHELWDDIYSRDDDGYPAGEDGGYGRAESADLSYAADDYDPEEEGTVVLSGTGNKRAAKLYGRNSVNNCNIALDRLPLTLGKLAGRVDLQLRDRSVSRIHAHINRSDDGGIVVKDMNSTNGTFLNGIRLRPNESVHIRTGDEICFGNMVFEYL